MEQQFEFSHFTKDDKFEIGNRINALRKQRRMTLEQLSQPTGIDPRVISRHENGQLCNVETLVKYAIVLGCSIEDLLPNRIASQINDETEEMRECWSLMMGIPKAQRKALLDYLSIVAIPKAN